MTRILEARFHPKKRGNGPCLIVGRVFCQGDQAEVRPVPVLNGMDASLDVGEVERKLRYLADTARPVPFERLRDLRSDFWSFVEVGKAD